VEKNHLFFSKCGGVDDVCKITLFCFFLLMLIIIGEESKMMGINDVIRQTGIKFDYQNCKTLLYPTWNLPQQYLSVR
jgi:hypothetical protein